MGCLKLENITHPEGVSPLKISFSSSGVLGKKGYAEKNRCNSYRYGFQGQEKDNELKGEGLSINYKYRMHDPRLGRFFAVDPLISKYPYYSSYAFSGNRVIDAFELEGAEPLKDEDGKISGNYKAKFRLNLPNGDGAIIYGDEEHANSFAMTNEDRQKIRQFSTQGFTVFPGNVNPSAYSVNDNTVNVVAQVGIDGVSQVNDLPNNQFNSIVINAPSQITPVAEVKQGFGGGGVASGRTGQMVQITDTHNPQVIAVGNRVAGELNNARTNLINNASPGATVDNFEATIYVNPNVQSSSIDLFKQSVIANADPSITINFVERVMETGRLSPRKGSDNGNILKAKETAPTVQTLQSLD